MKQTMPRVNKLAKTDRGRRARKLRQPPPVTTICNVAAFFVAGGPTVIGPLGIRVNNHLACLTGGLIFSGAAVGFWPGFSSNRLVHICKASAPCRSML